MSKHLSPKRDDSEGQEGAADYRGDIRLAALAVMVGTGFLSMVNGPFFTGLTRFLGMGNGLFSVITALSVVGGAFQLAASYFVEKTGKRKAIFLTFGFIQRSVWILIAFMPLITAGRYVPAAVGTVIAAMAVHSVSGSVMGMAYLSWIGDLVPPGRMGRFWAFRDTLCTIMRMLFGLLAAYLADTVEGAAGYALIFLLASLMGIGDILFFLFIRDPGIRRKTKQKPSMKNMLREVAGHGPFMRFMIFYAAWHFAFNMAYPFFNKYMIEYLHMGYMTIVLISQILSSLCTVAVIRLIGRAIDTKGARQVLMVACAAGSCVPALWCFASPQQYLVMLVIVHIVTGVFLGAQMAEYSMIVSNVVYQMTQSHNRGAFLAVQNLVGSVFGSALGVLAGGGVLEFLERLLEGSQVLFIAGQTLHGYHVLFLLSTALGLAVLALLNPYTGLQCRLRRFKESPQMAA